MAINFNTTTKLSSFYNPTILPFTCPKIGQVNIKTTDIYYLLVTILMDIKFCFWFSIGRIYIAGTFLNQFISKSTCREFHCISWDDFTNQCNWVEFEWCLYCVIIVSKIVFIYTAVAWWMYHSNFVITKINMVSMSFIELFKGLEDIIIGMNKLFITN